MHAPQKVRAVEGEYSRWTEEESLPLWPGLVEESPPLWPGLGEASLPLRPRLVRERSVPLAPDRSHSFSYSAGQDVEPEDEVFLLGERCAQAYLQADALHYRAMKLLAEFDRRDGWKDTGFSSTAEWLAWRIGIKPGAARERLRTALALEHLPMTATAMEGGELSYAKVRAITRVARPDNESTLLEFARAGSAANLERVVRGWRALDRQSEISAEEARHRRRRLSAWVDEDGMVVVKGRLDPEVGAVFMRAVEAASDALYRMEAKRGGEEGGRVEEGCSFERGKSTEPEQRRADAVGLMAERALSAGFGTVGKEESDDPGEDSIPVSGTRAERYQVMLHVDAGTLEEGGEPGRSELGDGTRVSAETSRRVACDARLVRIAHGADGGIVGAGRRSRTIPPSLRRALEARDRGCRFPGCGLRFTDAHHIKHWADGGETTLRNTILLCRAHHRAVHEGGVRVCLDRNHKAVFFTPRGDALFDAPQATAQAWEAVPTEVGGSARWKRDSEIPWEVEARAWEALDSD